MVHHDFGFIADRLAVAFNIDAQLLACLFHIIMRVTFHGFGKAVVAGHWRVAFQYVQNKTLLNGLLHAVAVKGPVLHLAAFGIGNAEHF